MFQKVSDRKALNLDSMMDEPEVAEQLDISHQKRFKEHQQTHPLDGMRCHEHFDWMLEKFAVCRENQMGPTFAVMAARVVSCLKDAKSFFPSQERQRYHEELEMIKQCAEKSTVLILSDVEKLS
jgi:hypothetical protein